LENARSVNRLGEPFGCGRLTAESDHRTNHGAMADKELIIGLLERVRRRVRSERRFKTIYSILSIALILPLVFKLIDLISPFRGTTVVVFLILWTIATAAWLLWRTRGQETLSQAAANLDRCASSGPDENGILVHPPSFVAILVVRVDRRSNT
jgi:hypothetical protein